MGCAAYKLSDTITAPTVKASPIIVPYLIEAGLFQKAASLIPKGHCLLCRQLPISTIPTYLPILLGLPSS